MADWCNNRLKISGPRDDIKRFIGASTDDVGSLSLSKLVPMPEKFETRNEWYCWSQENWGTKWDVNKEEKAMITLSELDQGLTEANCDFGSPETPPIAWQLTVSKMFPSLTFSLWYDEPVGDIAGLSEVKSGETLDASWEDSSWGFIYCSSPQCDETVDGFVAWVRTKDMELPKIFCETSHALEGAILKAIAEDESSNLDN
jgi:hypothetical protein